VVADLVRAVGGAVWIDEAPGGGARVGVRLAAGVRTSTVPRAHDGAHDGAHDDAHGQPRALSPDAGALA
jgi:hypothetical protein